MNTLETRFQDIYRQSTRQLGENFCIPAGCSNALRILDVKDDDCQLDIRDQWYASKNRPPESDVNDQMADASFEVVATYLKETGLDGEVVTSYFELPMDNEALNYEKADEAVEFIRGHTLKEHPVLVSTWDLDIQEKGLIALSHHIWLVLSVDLKSDVVVAHEPYGDVIITPQVSEMKSVERFGHKYTLDVGLRGCITHANYSCMALWRKST